MAHTTDYVRYADDLEQPRPGEEKTFDEIAALMGRLGALMFDRYRHATRSVHAKSHGLLRADLTVYDDLAPELAQGLFARPGTIPAIVRFSTNPGDILADSVSTPRGMAIKFVGVDGPMLPENQGNRTQDFVFVNAKTFPIPDAEHFLQGQKLIELNANDPELFKKAVSGLAAGTNAALGLVGIHSTTLEQLGAPHTHPLGETFGSTAALRYGDYVAKIIVAPTSENLRALTGKHLGVAFHYSALRDAIVEFFKTERAEWEVRVQLCASIEKMPIEDPSVEWPEDLSPYRPVAKLVAEPQDAYGPERRVFADEVLDFNPFHALAAHRPLGNIMRARRKSYAVSSQFRHRMNGHAAVEPTSIDQLP
jgi:hypothetical protein